MRRCIQPGCREYSVPGTSRCGGHSPSSGWRKRPPSNPYAYGGDWQRVRLVVLKRDGYRCQIGYADVCVGRASEVDHVIQPQAGGGDDLDNLRAVCRPCHARRTGQQGAWAKQRKYPR